MAGRLDHVWWYESETNRMLNHVTHPDDILLLVISSLLRHPVLEAEEFLFLYHVTSSTRVDGGTNVSVFVEETPGPTVFRRNTQRTLQIQLMVEVRSWEW